MSKTRPYKIWEGIIQRCTNKRNAVYKYYGGKGIGVCISWRNSFINFWEDMKEGYANDLSIDRIDNDGGYCKENCRWATLDEQERNKSNVKLYLYKKRNISLHEIANDVGIEYNTLKYRIIAMGESLEMAIDESIDRFNKNGIKKPVPVIQLSCNGTVIAHWKSMSQASKDTGVLVSSISQCVSGKIKTAGGFKWKLI